MWPGWRQLYIEQVKCHGDHFDAWSLPSRLRFVSGLGPHSCSFQRLPPHLIAFHYPRHRHLPIQFGCCLPERYISFARIILLFSRQGGLQPPSPYAPYAYGFKSITRSPYYARDTGKVEEIFKKSHLLTSLLDHRNTPPQGMTYSPAQRFLCRRTKSNLPISESLLGQSVPPAIIVRDEHLGRRAKAKAHYYKTSSRDLFPLAPGQFVYTRSNGHHRGEQWRHGEVTPRSYVVQTQEGQLDGTGST